MRLIDADALINGINNARECVGLGTTPLETFLLCQEAIRNCPTAYDVEAVVAELEVEKERHENDRTYWSEHSWKDSLMYNECDMSDRKADCLDRAISIVRGKE